MAAKRNPAMGWSRLLFWKLFVLYTALNLAAIATFVVIVSGWQEDQVIDQVTQRLHDSAALLRSDLADLLPQGRTAELQRRVQALSRQIDTRITLVAMDGEVLADSEMANLAEIAEMDNHGRRPELLQATADGRGASERTSTTVHQRMLYFALRADADAVPIGLVRTSLPLTEINAEVAALRRLIWLVAGSVSLVVIVVTYFLVARLVRPLTVLTQAAEAIGAGDFEHDVHVSSRDEMGRLAQAFNRMTERLRLRQSELRESNERLAAVLGGMGEGVLAVDHRDRIVLANAAVGRLLKISPEASTGRPLLECVRNHRLYQTVVDARNAAGPVSAEIELRDAQAKVIAVNAAAVAGEDSPRVVLVLHDVTELRRLETMRQDFVANVSHELKTPLSAIKAYAETLQSGAIDDDANNLRFVRQIEEQADRLSQLVLDLISLARIESGQQAFDIVPVDLAEVVESCLAGHQAAAVAKNISLGQAAEMPVVRVLADNEGLVQILDNLIDNAIKYTPERGRVTVGWRVEGNTVFIEVRDNGIGIPPEYLPRVFERFFRVDKARSRELGGTGLGLSIVKHLAQSFGGGVHVESQPGSGSTFAVSLPRA